MIRLSAMGDIVLATAALPELDRKGFEIHWLTLSAWAPLIEPDRRVHRVWGFDRSTGLSGWVGLVRNILNSERFDLVVDLHSSLRSRAAWWVAFFSRPRLALTGWRRARKARWRHWGLYVFKGLWPRIADPAPKWRLAVERVKGDTRCDRPRLELDSPRSAFPGSSKVRWAVMPASRWPAKEVSLAVWRRWLRPLLSTHELLFLGTSEDTASNELMAWWRSEGGDALDGIGRIPLELLASELTFCQTCLSVDTGVAHVAEAVGTPVQMVFAPTDPRMGFGPWRSDSKVIESRARCRPCSKDGTACYFRLTPWAFHCRNDRAFESSTPTTSPTAIRASETSS